MIEILHAFDQRANRMGSVSRPGRRPEPRKWTNADLMI